MIVFTWTRRVGGYSVERGKVLAQPPKKVEVVDFENLDPETVFLSFSQLDGSPDSIRAFAGTYGLLKNRTWEPLRLWRTEMESMHRFFKLRSEERWTDAQAVLLKSMGRQKAVNILPGPDAEDDGIGLFLWPRNLITWLWIQVGLNVKHRSVRTCRECGKFFLSGGGKANREKQSRKTQVYCGRKCRNTFNNRLLMKRKAKEGRR